MTRWYVGFLAGDAESSDLLVSEIWRVFSPFVKEMLRGWHSSYGEDDILQSAFGGFIKSIQRGAASGIIDRNTLSRYLYVAITHKVFEYRRREKRKRRGGDSCSRIELELDNLASRAPSPDEAILIEETIAQAMALLPSDESRAIACLKVLEGKSIDEIGMEVGRSPSTVRRRLERIEQLWVTKLLPTTDLD